VVTMEINVDARQLHLIADLEKDITKVIREALDLWLKKKIPTCPITNLSCLNIQGSCNHCTVTREPLG